MTLADDQPDETTDGAEKPEETPEVTPEVTPEATPDERLEALGADIERVRQQADTPIEEEDRQFIERGEEGPVDDTIAPPG